MKNHAKNIVTRTEFNTEKLRSDIMTQARAIGVPVGAAEPVAQIVAQKVGGWVAQRPAVTEEDLNRRVVLELTRYNEDLAYVYQNRGKII